MVVLFLKMAISRTLASTGITPLAHHLVQLTTLYPLATPMKKVHFHKCTLLIILVWKNLGFGGNLVFVSFLLWPTVLESPTWRREAEVERKWLAWGLGLPVLLYKRVSVSTWPTLLLWVFPNPKTNWSVGLKLKTCPFAKSWRSLFLPKHKRSRTDNKPGGSVLWKHSGKQIDDFNVSQKWLILRFFFLSCFQLRLFFPPAQFKYLPHHYKEAIQTGKWFWTSDRIDKWILRN